MQQKAIGGWLKDGLRLTKSRKLLARQGVELPYPTLHRFAVLELGFGRTLRARADQHTARVYDGLTLVKTRQPPSGRSTDPADFPAERSIYALRNVDPLRLQAAITARPSAALPPPCSAGRCRGRASRASTRCSASRAATARRA